MFVYLSGGKENTSKVRYKIQQESERGIRGNQKAPEAISKKEYLKVEELKLKERSARNGGNGSDPSGKRKKLEGLPPIALLPLSSDEG